MYVVAGGAPIYVSSFANVPTIAQRVMVDENAIDAAGSGGSYNHLRATPADGTVIHGATTGNTYRVQSGHAPAVTNYTGTSTAVDQAAIDNAGTGGAYNHLA